MLKKDSFLSLIEFKTWAAQLVRFDQWQYNRQTQRGFNFESYATCSMKENTMRTLLLIEIEKNFFRGGTLTATVQSDLSSGKSQRDKTNL